LSNDYDKHDIGSPNPHKLARHSSNVSSNGGFDDYSRTLFNEEQYFDHVNPYVVNKQFEDLKPMVDTQLLDELSTNAINDGYNEDYYIEEVSGDCFSLSPTLSSLTRTTNDVSPIATPNKNSSHSGNSSHSAVIQNTKNPADVVRVKHIQGIPLTDNDIQVLLKDRQKKDNHNMIERRRRFNINDKIRELCNLLPNSGINCFSEGINNKRLNKGVILKESVEYIKFLKYEYGKLRILQEKYDSLSELNKELLRRLESTDPQSVAKLTTINHNILTISPSTSSGDKKYNEMLIQNHYSHLNDINAAENDKHNSYRNSHDNVINNSLNNDNVVLDTNSDPNIRLNNVDCVINQDSGLLFQNSSTFVVSKSTRNCGRDLNNEKDKRLTVMRRRSSRLANLYNCDSSNESRRNCELNESCKRRRLSTDLANCIGDEFLNNRGNYNNYGSRSFSKSVDEDVFQCKDMNLEFKGITSKETDSLGSSPSSATCIINNSNKVENELYLFRI
ncbi:hypothetical protein GJ496_001765, partial [Pomphorhynchus laevis]